jgi:hypothetical protein
MKNTLSSFDWFYVVVPVGLVAIIMGGVWRVFWELGISVNFFLPYTLFLVVLYLALLDDYNPFKDSSKAWIASGIATFLWVFIPRDVFGSPAASLIIYVTYFFIGCIEIGIEHRELRRTFKESFKVLIFLGGYVSTLGLAAAFGGNSGLLITFALLALHDDLKDFYLGKLSLRTEALA